MTEEITHLQSRIKELEGVREAIGQIARMKLVPDDAMNRMTLFAALKIARAAIKEKTDGRE